MRILKNIFLFLFLASASMSNAQLTISTEGGEAAMGTNLEVDITANEFNSLSTFQFNVVWDSLVMTFVEVKNVNQDLTSYSVATNFGLPGDGSIKDGRVSTSWTNFSQAESLSDDTRLFTIVLSAIGAECATSSFGFDNEEAVEKKINSLQNKNSEQTAITHISCKDDWSVVLPSIIGEAEGDKFTIEVMFGNVDKIINFDQIKRTQYTIQPR